MPTVLITGATRGLGLGFATQYAETGWTVIGTARDPQAAHDLDALAARTGRVSVLRYDATEFADAAALATALGGKPIDLLINNAAVFGGFSQTLGELGGDGFTATFAVNTISPVLLTQALRPNLEAGDGKTVVMITSQMGSIDDNRSGGWYYYRASKAALNMAVKSLSIDLKPARVTVITMHPGWVKTSMGGENAPLEIHESVEGMRNVIDGLRIEDSGKFFGYHGQEIPW